MPPPTAVQTPSTMTPNRSICFLMPTMAPDTAKATVPISSSTKTRTSDMAFLLRMFFLQGERGEAHGRADGCAAGREPEHQRRAAEIETSEPSSVLSEMATIVRSDWAWTRSAGATDSFAK